MAFLGNLQLSMKGPAGMQDSGLDFREKAEDFSQPWFLPGFEMMACSGRKKGGSELKGILGIWGVA